MSLSAIFYLSFLIIQRLVNNFRAAVSLTPSLKISPSLVLSGYQVFQPPVLPHR